MIGPPAGHPRTLLVELLTEELPPKALRRIGDAFAQGLADGLRQRGLLGPDSTVRAFATPRRLAASVTGVRPRAPDRQLRERLMPVSVALDPHGKPTVALARKLASLGLSQLTVADLERSGEGKAESLFHTRLASGAMLDSALQETLDEVLPRLPIPKVMSYQRPDGTTVRFVRPAHALVALHGNEIVLVTALGLLADRVTRGHRFQGAREIPLRDADEYETRLADDGNVIAGFAARRAEIAKQIEVASSRLGFALAEHDALLDEVTALVEYPTVYVGHFDEAFLDVPQECLILTMQQNQKYFPLFDGAGALQASFLIVSNMRLEDPSRVIHGNERVIRPRLADARFFYDTDRKESLASRVERLADVVHHAKLGSQLDRVRRLCRLASPIALQLDANPELAERAALLCKSDLVTAMVGEFPELQGVMGRYYARHDGEPPAVCDAIEAHYHPRFAGDSLPESPTGTVVALADKLDALVGMFGIDLVPSGDRDPFGLRRQALGVVRLLVERSLPLDVVALLEAALSAFPPGRLKVSTVDEVHAFMIDRLRGYLRDAGYAPDEIESVLAVPPRRFDDLLPRLAAVQAFRELPESEALATANKRIGNILRKSEAAAVGEVDASRLVEPAERALHLAVSELAPVVDRALDGGDFAAALKALAGIRGDVDRFFDQVLVNAEDAGLRSNRLALLSGLNGLMNRVAEIGRLAG